MLKVANDGLTKSWKPEKVWEPFYKGGKIQYTNDGKRFVCEYEGNIKVVSVEDPSDVFTLFDEESEEERPAVTCFALHPNGEEIVVATSQFSLCHYNLKEKTLLRTIKAHRMPILCLDYDPTGTLVASGSADRSVRVWDITKGYCTHSFTNVHTDIVKTVYFHPDPQRLELFSTSDDNSIAMFDLRDQQCVAQFREHFSLPTQVAVSSDGYLLVSCGRDKVLNFYELRDRKHVKTIPVMDELEALVVLDGEASRLVLQALSPLDKNKKKASVSSSSAPQQHVIVTAGAHGMMRVFSCEMRGKDVSSFSVTSLFSLPLSALSLTSVTLSEEMSTLKGISRLLLRVVSSDEEKGVGERLRVTALTNDFNFVSFSVSQLAQGVQRIAQQADDEESDTVLLTPCDLLVSNHGDILDLIRLPSNKTTSSDSSFPVSFRLAIVSNSPQLRIVDEKMKTSVCEGHTDIILAADVSPCGDWMVTSSKDRTVRLWYLPHMQCRAICEGHTDPVGAVTLCRSLASYASRKVCCVSGAGDKILKRWSLPLHTLATPAALALTSHTVNEARLVKMTSTHSVRAHDKDINCVVLSPNDALLASASQDKTVRLWNTADLTPVATLSGHKRGVWKVVFAPTDQVLASCSGDRSVKLWSMKDYSLIQTLEGHSASVLSARFVQRGTQLVSASADGLLRLWTLRSGECETSLDVHSDRVWAVETLTESDECRPVDKEEQDATTTSSVLQSTRFFVSAGSDARIVLWKDVTAEEEQQRLQEQEQMLVLEQQLQNDLRNKRYGPALTLALSLAKPSKVLMILSAILEEEKTTSSTSPSSSTAFQEDFSLRLDPFVKSMTDEQLQQLLDYLKDWNTNSRHCYVSQILLNALFRCVKVEKMLSWKSFKEMAAGLQAYTDRHLQRVNRLSQAAHFLDYVVSLISLMPMESLDALAVAPVQQKEPLVNDAPQVVSEIVVEEIVEKQEKMVAVAQKKKGKKRKAE